MNNIYKVIWSKAKNCYVVASEIARSHTKSATGSEKIGGVTRRSLLASLMALSLLCGGLGVASAANGTVHVAESSASSDPAVYTTEKVDTLLKDKADKTALENKANATDVTKNTGNIATNTANINTLRSELGNKADKSYVDNAVDGAVTTAGTNVNEKLKDYAKTTYVDTEVGKKANKATTLAGYEITDAYTKEEVYNKGEVARKLDKKADLTALNQATDKINDQQTAIDDLKQKTKEISHVDGDGTTISGVRITDGNIVGNGNSAITGLTNVETNSIKTDIINGKNLEGNMVATDKDVEKAVKAETDAREAADTALGQRIDKEIQDRKEADTTLEGKINTLKETGVKYDNDVKDTITLAGLDGTKITHLKDATLSDSSNDAVTGKQLYQTNENLAAETATRESKDNELAGKIQDNADAIDATNKRTAGIKRDDDRNETTIENNVTVDDKGNVTAKGKLKGEVVDAGAVNAGSLIVENASTLKGDVTMDKTLKVTGDTSLGKTDVGGALNVTGASNLQDNVILGTNAANTVTVNGKSDFKAAVEMDDGLTVKNGDTNLKNTNVEGNLKVTGTITTDTMIFGDKPTNYTEIDKGHITSKNAALAGDATQQSSSMEFDRTKLEVGVADKDSNGHLTMTADKTTIKNSDLTEKNYSEIVADKDSVRTTVKDEKNNTTSTKSSATEIRNYAKDAAGNKTINVQTATQNKSWAKDKDGNESSIVQTGKDITNTAQNGTITNDANHIVNKANTMDTNVTGKATESYGELETNVNGKATENFKGGLDTTVTGAENHTVTGTQTNTVGGGQINNISGGQKNNILTGDQETTVSNGSIINKAENGNISNTAKNVTNEGTESVTNKAGDMTVTTDKTTGTTFGNGTPNDTTVINGGTIGTNKVNANETNTKKLTAGADDGANGGRLTVDADGVKGSYKSDKYTSKSYILRNTLKSGVDNDKDPTDTDFVGSRTDHYMDGDKAKLDETVKDADGSNVTKKTSTDTATTITDGITTTKTEQGTKDITNTATAGTITNDAKVITNKASEVINNEAININNTATGTITSKASEIKNEADKLISNKVGENTWENMEDGKITTSIKNGTKQNLTQSDAEKTEHSVVNGSNSTVNKQTSEEITDAVTNGTTTNVTQNTATSSNNTIADTNGNANTVVSTVDGTKFTNTGANTAIREGTVTDTTIKGNTITTGQVKMDYAQVMRDLGVNGNAKIDGKTTTGSLEVTGTSTLTGDVTMKNNATVGGTLEVTGEATFHNDVDITGDVTAKSYKVGGKTYIDVNGINANNQKITNVADGSISEGSKDAVNGGQLYNVKNDLEGKVNKVGANAAAMANLHPMEFDPDSKWNIAAAIGNYGSETAAALGAFYRPNDDVMVNFSTAFGTGENMVGGGVSVRLGKSGNKLSREESNALKDQVNDLTARMDALLSVLNPNMSKDFPDVPENHWAYEAVSRLAGNDIVQGYPDGEFHGERTMTRYEMAEIIYNALSRGAEAEKELVEEFKPELQAMAASEKATAERAEG